MFTLGDPRLQAISQAGSNLGSGLGKALVRFAENKNLQKGLQGVTAQTPINEILQKFAEANVSPEILNTYLSPAVQQRLGQERSQQAFQDIANMSPEQMRNTPYFQLVAKLAGSMANTPEGFRAIEPILNALKVPSGQPMGKGKGMNGFPGQEGVTPPGSIPGVNESQFQLPNFFNQQPAQITTEGPSGTKIPQPQQTAIPRAGIETPPGIVPQTGENIPRPSNEMVYRNINDYLQNTTGATYPEALEWAKGMFNLEEAQLDRIYKAQEKQETQRKQVVAEQDRIREQTQGFILNDPEFTSPDRTLNGTLKNMLMDFMLAPDNLKGTDETRYQKSKKKITDLQDRIRGVSEGATRPFLGGARPEALKNFLSEKRGSAQSILNDSRIPEDYKPGIREMLRTALAETSRPFSIDNVPMFGPVEIETIVNPPTNNLNKYIKAMPEGITARDFEDDPSGSQKKYPQQQQKLTEFWARLAKNNMDSPLYAAQELIDKGYRQEDIVNAFDEAQEKGASFSEYQLNQRTDYLGKPMVPNLSTIFGFDPSYRSIFHGISGKK